MAVNKINDGGKSTGSPTLNIYKFNGTTFVSRDAYICDDFSLDTATNQQVFADADTIPTGAVTTRSLVTGRATVQYATSSTDTPEIGDAFKYTLNGATGYYILTADGKQTSKGEESKAVIQFYKVLNPTTVKMTAVGGSETGDLDLTALITT